MVKARIVVVQKALAELEGPMDLVVSSLKD